MYTGIRQAPKRSVSHDSKVLWKRAFDALSEAEADILNQYARQLSEQNTILIDKILRERQIKQWTIKLAGRSLKLRELGQNILVPNQKEQSETMMKGLDRVSFLIGLYMEWDELYLDNTNVSFHDTVVKLYSSILTYQARLLTYLSKHPTKRFLRNAAKVDDWEAFLTDVDKWDERCDRFTTLIDVEKGRESWNQQYLQLSEQCNVSAQILAALIDIRQEKLQRLSKEQDSQRIELVRSLSSDYKRQKDNNPQRVIGTCEWFVKDERFCEWRDSKDSRLLHVYAGPGCGKSVLTRYLIDDRLIATSKTASVLYFFFKDGQEAQQKCENAIAAMLHQLYTEPSQKGMAVHAITKFEAHGAKLSTMFDELWDVFRNTLEDPMVGEVICIIDALDECLKQDHERPVQKITEYFSDREAIQKAGGRLKILITSRPYGYIDTQYGLLSGNSAFVRLDGSEKASLIAAEINLVIDAKVPHYIPKVSKTVQEAIIKHLQSIENRTYLWLYLILDFIKDNIAGRGTEKKIKDLIKELPPTINEAYQKMLSKSVDYEQAKLLLQLVVAAERPLSVSEVKVALAFTQEDYQRYSDFQEDVESDDHFEESLKDLCGLLLSVYDSRVYLIHQTAREFLTQTTFSLSNRVSSWQGPINTVLAEAVVSRICIFFLCLQDFQIQPSWGLSNLSWYVIEKRVGQLVDKFTFIRYAAEYWAEHVQKGQDMIDISLLSKEVQLCRTKSGSFWTWYPVFFVKARRDVFANETDLIFLLA
ncbi:hypothetical protein MMC26_006933 [Xylographa opegraphella]|nr:hypothetical protein [Xylographa opegraphella]